MEALSTRLRRETRELHAAAERAGVMRRLLRRRVERTGYVALLRSLGAIYDALESALDRCRAHPALGPLDFPALRRRERLAQDLAFLGAGAGPADGALPGAAERYVARLHAVEAVQPERLAAHAYVRYLGDLNGGRVLRAAVAESLGLADERGTAFYDYPPGSDLAGLQREFRRGLDVIGTDAAVAEAVVDEARVGFRMHVALFEELDASAEGAELSTIDSRLLPAPR